MPQSPTFKAEACNLRFHCESKPDALGQPSGGAQWSLSRAPTGAPFKMAFSCRKKVAQLWFTVDITLIYFDMT